MAKSSETAPSLLAVSDLHVSFEQNRPLITDLLVPRSPGDWLIVAGDLGELVADIEWVLKLLRSRFAKVIWVPGNHELWTHKRETITLRGVERYHYLVEFCRGLGVVTPEDPYPVWEGPGGKAVIAPLFLLYDYTFRPEGTSTKAESLAVAYNAGIVATDEVLLAADPYPSIDAWCAARLELTERRLAELPDDSVTVLVNHFPLVREPTRVLRYPEFAQWCGTTATASWPTRFRAVAVVYGHLHIPRTTWHDGIRHEEVSLGYPREWQRRGYQPRIPRQILPVPPG
ncbi:MAG TPA: metallophosphoesterase [Streptosporangiaceae bacterium]|nr:metallophosphoesterase [Streptosporangiaceae bacterium]